MFCTQCGQQLNDGARFCTACGAAVAALAGRGAAAAPEPPPAEAKPQSPDRMPVRTEAEFRTFYQNSILPALKEVEKLRLECRRRIVAVRWITCAFIVLVLAIAVGLSSL
ncbi:MAG: zinc ribbon domain-containing protein [Kiritimatiellae bacterium]|nr:zinc ribbon domain-containing protein [Kiritimatiellia bacterium]